MIRTPLVKVIYIASVESDESKRPSRLSKRLEPRRDIRVIFYFNFINGSLGDFYLFFLRIYTVHITLRYLTILV